MERTKERSLFVVRKRPQKYPLTHQQQNFRRALEECGISKGITQHELVDKMVNCLPAVWAKIKEEEGAK